MLRWAIIFLVVALVAAVLGFGGIAGTVPAPGAGDAAENKFLKADGSWVPAGLRAASQSDQESGASNTVAVTPGRQQFHSSAAKMWGYVTLNGGVPTLQASYNITSITDADVGRLVVTIATDFSSANWGLLATLARDDAAAGYAKDRKNSHSAGTFEVMGFNSTGTLIDPDAYNFAGYGDQ